MTRTIDLSFGEQNAGEALSRVGVAHLAASRLEVLRALVSAGDEAEREDLRTLNADVAALLRLSTEMAPDDEVEIRRSPDAPDLERHAKVMRCALSGLLNDSTVDAAALCDFAWGLELRLQTGSESDGASPEPG